MKSNNKETQEENNTKQNSKNSQIEKQNEEKEEPLKEEEFTMKEYLDNMNKELLVISKFEKDEQVKKCTYEKGYITQEIYVCLTCAKEKNSISGMCVGCAYKCHENHDIENLHFKRNFRCDCGNSNYFISCELQQEKEVLNSKNAYNHNFSSKYCHCDSEDRDEMIQCLICEDWFHFPCLEFKDLFDLTDNQDANLICRKCVKGKIDFFIAYPNFTEALRTKSENFNIIVPDKVERDTNNNLNKEFFDNQKPEDFNLLGKKRNNCSDQIANSINEDNDADKNLPNEKTSKTNNFSNINLDLNESCEKGVVLRNPINNADPLSKDSIELPEFNCPLNQNISDEKSKITKTIIDNNLDILVDINRFFNILCKCENCLKLYSDRSMSFLSTKEDFIDDWNNRELLEDKLDEQANLDNEENREIISKIDNFNINLLPEVREMPIEKQIILNQTMNNLSTFFAEYVQNNPPEDNVISGEYIKNMLKEFNSIKKN